MTDRTLTYVSLSLSVISLGYDGKLRRRVRTEFVWTNSAWVTGQVVRYVYDDNVVVQERDQYNVPQLTYTRGSDLSGSFEGAGGIGGLLAIPRPLSAPSTSIIMPMPTATSLLSSPPTRRKNH